MYLLLSLISLLLEVYIWVIILTVVMSWLVNFNVVNPYNPAIRSIQNICYSLTEPLLGPLRRMLPNFGGLDISPLVLLVGIAFLQRFLRIL